MSFEVKMDTRKINSAFDDFQRGISAKNLERFVDHEAGRVLVSAAKKTEQATAGSINKDLQDLKSKQRAGSQGSAKWKAFLAKKKKQIAEKKKRIGLARQTWLYIGETLGLDVSGTGLNKARSATVDGSKIAHKSSGRRIRKGKDQYGIKITYSNPVGRFAKVTRALGGAIHGRAKFFERNLKDGVFRSAHGISKKYPGLKITKQ